MPIPETGFDLARHTRALSAAPFFLGFALLAGCEMDTTATPPAPTTTTCDPLVAHPLPVTLGTVLGVGRNAQGNVYLADQVDMTATSSATYRVFVSSGMNLYRKRVTGNDKRGALSNWDYALSYQDGTTQQALLIQVRNGSVTAMGLGPAGTMMFLPSTDRPLSVVQPDVVSSMTLVNLPGDVVIEEVGTTPDGNAIVVTRPMDDWTYSDFRVFYGQPPELLERSLVRGFDASGQTNVTFNVSFGESTGQFTLLYPSASGPSGTGPTGAPAGMHAPILDMGNGTTLPVTASPAIPNSLKIYTFSCLSP
jgi:hypothetical protein